MEAFIREFKRKLLSFIHNTEYRLERMRLEPLLKNYDPRICSNNIKPAYFSEGAPLTIAFVITRLVRFHGGQTSVLRLGTQLSRLGYNVVYTVYKQQSVEEMKLCAESNLKNFEGQLIPLKTYRRGIRSKKYQMPDIITATSWDTVSYVKPFKAYKMYFVQDYEPYFYPFGERFLMARSTYEQGLHMVSLGSWNKEMIEKNCTVISPADTVSFPYERSEYNSCGRDYDSYPLKRKLTIAVYLKFYGKRLPNLIPMMLSNTADKLKKRGIELEVLYYGEAKTFKARGGRNLGMLSKEELNALYNRADFGLVASMSNISLVPYEMHATGLPVIEFADGTYPFFFPGDTALLTRIGETDIADLLINAINSPDSLRRMSQRAAEYMNSLSWERTGREFDEIVRRNSEV